MEPCPDSASELRRWSERLRATIYDCRKSQSAVERGLGWSSGYLTQILRPGPPALKAEHVLEILAFLGVPWDEFFRGLYPGGTDTRAAEAIARLIEERAEAAARAAVAEALPPAG